MSDLKDSYIQDTFFFCSKYHCDSLQSQSIDLESEKSVYHFSMIFFFLKCRISCNIKC